MPTLLSVPVGTSEKYVALRSTGSVVLVEDSLVADYQEPQILATSAAGCQALGEALIDMAQAIRVRKAEGGND